MDLSEIKATIFNLLPSTLGKNAIVEAELEVKTFTETESVDYEVYEHMRKMAKDTFPVDEAISLLREKCFEYCTLADKEDQLYLQKSIQKRNNNKTIIISPIIAIYVTTIMEHIAEYLLTAVAMSAEHEETDYVRVKEVYLALIDDVQLGNVFSKMNLKERTEVSFFFLFCFPFFFRKTYFNNRKELDFQQKPQEHLIYPLQFLPSAIIIIHKEIQFMK